MKSKSKLIVEKENIKDFLIQQGITEKEIDTCHSIKELRMLIERADDEMYKRVAKGRS